MSRVATSARTAPLLPWRANGHTLWLGRVRRSAACRLTTPPRLLLLLPKRRRAWAARNINFEANRPVHVPRRVSHPKHADIANLVAQVVPKQRDVINGRNAVLNRKPVRLRLDVSIRLENRERGRTVSHRPVTETKRLSLQHIRRAIASDHQMHTLRKRPLRKRPENLSK